MKKIIIYSSSICPYCVSAKRLLENLNLNFEEKSIDHDMIINAVSKIEPRGLDYAVESVGKPNIIPLCVELLKRQGGKLVVIGNSPSGETFELKPDVLGSWGGNSNPDTDFDDYSKLLIDSKPFLKKLISKTYSLEKINDALSDLSKGIVGRPLIRM